MMQDVMQSRLSRLRAAIKNAGVDGFLIPRGDAFFGEEVPPRDERLLYISGFSGSAGQAVVTLEKAALFSDGRYDLQMPAEVSDDWHCFVTPESSLNGWLGDNFSGRMGFDPWLMRHKSWQQLDDSVQWIPLKDNLIDRIWDDRPKAVLTCAPTDAPTDAWNYPINYAGLSRQQKMTDIAKMLEIKGAKHLIITAPDQLAWLLNIRGGDLAHTPLILAFAIFSITGEIVVFADENRFQNIDQDGLTFRPSDAILDYLGGLNPAEIAFDPSDCPHAIARILGGALAQPSPIPLMKARKTDAEQAAIRYAHRLDGVAMARFLAKFSAANEAKKPIRETEAGVALLAERRRMDGFICPSFETICGSGGNGAIVHYHAKAGQDAVIEQNTLCLIDSGGQYLSGTTDITRTLAIGAPSDAMRRDATIVLKAHIALDCLIYPIGSNGAALDSVVRSVMWKYGMDFAHGTGHGVGCCLSVHEGPVSISKRSDGVIEAGMLLSNEPGYYVTGQYGIRIENLVLSIPHPDYDGYLCFDPVTLVPFDKKLIDPALLDGGEIAWLDSYHARIYDEIAPLLDGEDETLAWLYDATRPL